MQKLIEERKRELAASHFYNSLTPEERERMDLLLKMDAKTISRLSRIAEEDERMEWLWAGIRRISSTVALVVGAMVLFWEQVKAFIQGLLK